MKSHAERITTLFGEPFDRIVEELDQKLNKFVGPFIGTIYSFQKDSFRQRVSIDMKTNICTCDWFQTATDDQSSNHNGKIKNTETEYSKDELLRDLFLWSVFMDMPEMAKILLVHQQSRICAALIASAIFKKYAKQSTTADHKEKFGNQSLDFETYAANFIDKCYKHNERLACELLLRQIPMFGNVTCMQVSHLT
jgi:hypothetical protein